jgi:hypothetical protein
MILLLCALAALVYLAVVACLLVGWGGMFSTVQRAGLAISAMGIVGAGIPRFLGHPPGWFDVFFVGGLVTFFAATYGPAIFRNIDGLDGVFDRKLDLRRTQR